MLKKIWWLVACAILIVVFLPLGIDWLIIGNNFPSNISNSDWVGFFGGYIGSLLGCTISLVGILYTIKFTKQQIRMNQTQFEEQKRMNYIPILDCSIIAINMARLSGAVSLDVEYTFSNSEQLFPCTVDFVISNIGPGAALEIKYGIELDEKVQDGTFWLEENRLIRSQGKITQSCVFYIPKNKEFSPTLLIYYEDVLGNKYVKRVALHLAYDETSKQLEFFIFKQDKGVILRDPQTKQYYVINPQIVEVNSEDK